MVDKKQERQERYGRTPRRRSPAVAPEHGTPIESVGLWGGGKTRTISEGAAEFSASSVHWPRAAQPAKERSSGSNRNTRGLALRGEGAWRAVSGPEGEGSQGGRLAPSQSGAPRLSCSEWPAGPVRGDRSLPDSGGRAPVGSESHGDSRLNASFELATAIGTGSPPRDSDRRGAGIRGFPGRASEPLCAGQGAAPMRHGQDQSNIALLRFPRGNAVPPAMLFVGCLLACGRKSSVRHDAEAEQGRHPTRNGMGGTATRGRGKRRWRHEFAVPREY